METAANSRVELLAALWRDFADREAGPYSPLYAGIARVVATHSRLLQRVIDDVPPHGHLPISLLAAVHDRVLRGSDHPLVDAYAHGPADAAPTLFVDFCEVHWVEIVDTLHVRRVQTNECGRSAPIALALARVAEVLGTVAVLVDDGASAGLNLLYDRYHLDYGARGCLGDPRSPVRVHCTVTGPGSVPTDLPTIGRRIGLDRDPIDVTDEDDRRWLLACVWPDTDRLERTAAALRIAAAHPPDVRRGDMVRDLRATIDIDDTGGPVCVMTSWAAGYLSRREREDFTAVLVDVARQREVVWLSLEHRSVLDLVVPPSAPARFDIEPSVVGLTHFRGAERDARVIGLVHPHGQSVHWVEPIAS